MAGKKNAVVGQSGGPTAVINQSLVGVIEEVVKSSHIEQLFGARHGVRGIVNEQFISLRSQPRDLLEKIAASPAAALGSTRDKPDAEYCRRIFDCFKKHDIHYFFYIGGNDSADTARIVHDLARQEGYELQVFHIPKTIDNDLRVHDHCPGYGSAARYVAAALIGDNLDNKSLPGVKVNVIMGRNAGFLTAAAVLARQHEQDGPHLIYVPEVPLDLSKLLADVEDVYRRKGRCLIAVSEGVRAPDGRLWNEKLSDQLDRDMHGNIQLSGTGALGDFLAHEIRKGLSSAGGKKIRARADTYGYPQRSFPGFASEVDAREARLVGRVAVQLSRTSDANGSIAMRRIQNDPYTIETFLAPLDAVARETRQLDAAYIENGNNIRPAFREYAAPLVGPLPEVATFPEMRD
ncbi:MAG: 6-phosphofructokinase [Phycisphaerae bacterium]|nr:6-phosphofructokinase [Phycisphaerae bacterium]MDW8262850.1 6-phosphofructokinase [Phycisphaerales bacterium]